TVYAAEDVEFQIAPFRKRERDRVVRRLPALLEQLQLDSRLARRLLDRAHELVGRYARRAARGGEDAERQEELQRGAVQGRVAVGVGEAVDRPPPPRVAAQREPVFALVEEHPRLLAAAHVDRELRTVLVDDDQLGRIVAPQRAPAGALALAGRLVLVFAALQF